MGRGIGISGRGGTMGRHGVGVFTIGISGGVNIEYYGTCDKSEKPCFSLGTCDT